MYNKVYYDHQPAACNVEVHNDKCYLWVRKNITQEQQTGDTGETYTMWSANEAYTEMSADEAPETSDVESDIDSWYEYASEWSDDTPDIATEIAALNAKYDYLIAITGGTNA